MYLYIFSNFPISSSHRRIITVVCGGGLWLCTLKTSSTPQQHTAVKAKSPIRCNEYSSGHSLGQRGSSAGNIELNWLDLPVLLLTNLKTFGATLGAKWNCHVRKLYQNGYVWKLMPFVGILKFYLSICPFSISDLFSNWSALFSDEPNRVIIYFNSPFCRHSIINQIVIYIFRPNHDLGGMSQCVHL